MRRRTATWREQRRASNASPHHVLGIGEIALGALKVDSHQDLLFVTAATYSMLCHRPVLPTTLKTCPRTAATVRRPISGRIRKRVWYHKRQFEAGQLPGYPCGQ